MNHPKKPLDKIVFNIISYVILTVLAIVTLLPFLLIISASFSSNEAVQKYGFSLLPREFSLEAYEYIFAVPATILRAYGITIFITVVGSFLMLIISSMSGYVLSRKDYKYRNQISFFLFFTTLFSGGLVPWYMLCVRFLHFKDHPLTALILPMLFNYFYIIIFRSFMSGIPDAISESAKIDGANDFTIYLKLILPMSKPVLATIALFGALGYWNDWFNALLFIKDPKFYPLQYFLYKILNSMNALSSMGAQSIRPIADLIPSETFKFAMTIITIGPIVLVYPFLQKYFIKGITVGAVKG